MLQEVRPVTLEVREALRRGLMEVGCPGDTATALAGQATSERHAEDDVAYLCLVGICVPLDGGSVTVAVDALTDNAAADDAEANDRAARGKPGWEPLWPLLDRRPRR